jgi:ATP-dependent Clp protease ATP-binding subunit ClpA
VSTSIDLPLTSECKRILAYAAEEAEALRHRHIGTEHLLLGILREEHSMAAEILTELGLRLDAVREQLAKDCGAHVETPKGERGFMDMYSQGTLPEEGVVPDKLTAKAIAEAIWTAHYCKELDDRVEPATSELNHDVWIVTGRHMRGSTQSNLVAIVQKVDGKVLRVYMEK